MQRQSHLLLSHRHHREMQTLSGYTSELPHFGEGALSTEPLGHGVWLFEWGPLWFCGAQAARPSSPPGLGADV